MIEEDAIEAAGVWVPAAIERCRHALGAARTAADRAALLRSMARLKGGRLDLGVHSIMPTPDELANYPRLA